MRSGGQVSRDFAPKSYKDQYWQKGPIDYSHEREWRVPKDLKFAVKDGQFVIIDTYEDMAQAPGPLKDAIGRENGIIMSNYSKIEKLWPQHVV